MKSRARAEQRKYGWAAAAVATRQHGWAAVLSSARTAPRVKLAIEFLPPDRRRRDADNLLASCKGLLDGIADALAIDDSKFSITFALNSEPIKFGGVRITIGETA